MPEGIREADAEQTQIGLIDRLRQLLGGPAYATVTTQYGAPSEFTAQPHTGIDFAAADGTPIHAPVGGTFSSSFDAVGGNQVMVTTPSGFQQIFAHLLSYPAKFTQTRDVQAGDVIGYVGHTGLASGPHLHYEVVKPNGKSGQYSDTVDPLTFIGEFSDKPTDKPDPLTPKIIARIESAAREAVTKIRFSFGLYSESNAADDLRKQFPTVSPTDLGRIVTGLATKPADQGGPPDPQDIPVLGGIGGVIARGFGFVEHPNEAGRHTEANPLQAIANALGNIATDVDRLTRDLTDPQRWATYGLTVVGAGLIVIGVIVYVRSGK